MKKILALFAAAAVFAASGCGNYADEPVSFPDPEGTAVIGISEYISGHSFFTDAWGTSHADRDIQHLIYGAGTIAVSPDGVLIPDTSTLKSMNTRDERNGARTYIFTLNDDLCYSNGSPVTASDYVFSVLLQSSPEFSRLDRADNTRYSCLEGWEDFSTGRSSIFSGVELISSNSFSLTIRADVLPCYQELLLINVYPFPMSVLAPGGKITEDNGAGWEGVSSDLLRASILGDSGYRNCPAITSGPYSVTSVSGKNENMQIELTANPYYNGGFSGIRPSIKTLRISSADMDRITEMEPYDLICNISGRDEMDRAAVLLNDETVKGNFFAGREVSSILFGPDIPVNTRRAIPAILDQNEFSNILAGSWGSPAAGLVPAAGLDNDFRILLQRYSPEWNNPELADTLLEDSEPVLEFVYDENDPGGRGEKAAEILAEAAADTGLLTIEPMPLSTSEIIRRIRSGSYDLLFYNDSLPLYAAPGNGPEIIVGSELADAAGLLTHTSSAFTDRYHQRALEFCRLYLEELPALGMCSYEQCVLIGSRLEPTVPDTDPSDWTSLILRSYIHDEEQ